MTTPSPAGAVLAAARESAQEGAAACQKLAAHVKELEGALAAKKPSLQAPHLKAAWDEVAKAIDLLGSMKDPLSGLAQGIAKAEQAIAHAHAQAGGGKKEEQETEEGETDGAKPEEKKAPSHLIPDLAKVKAGKSMFFLLVRGKATPHAYDLLTGPSKPAAPPDGQKIAAGVIVYDGGMHVFETKNLSEVKAGVKQVFRDSKINLPFDVRVKATKDGEQEDDEDEGEEKEKAPEGADVLERIAALRPEVERLVAGGKPTGEALGKVFGQVAGLAQAKDFAKAGAALDRIGPLLEKARAEAGTKAPAPGTQPGGDKSVSSVAFTKLRLDWLNARKHVATELAKLVTAVKAGAQGEDPDGSFGPDTVAEMVEGLQDVLENLDTRLIDKLDEALVAKTPPERAARQVEARAIVGEYLDYIEGEQALQELDDGSGFGTFAVVGTARDALARMAREL